jgi:uncharacterized protein with FMN-binding domain
MKRAILIATGTVGGLGAVFAVTPPQFTSTQSSSMALPGADVATAAPSAAATTSTTPSAAASAKATKSATKPRSASPSAAQSQAAAATPAPVKTTAPTTQSATGTFTGDSIDVRYGFVQVKITVENGKITDAQAVKSPSGRNDRYTQMSVPVLRQRTLASQSANISGVSGASFTSYGWYTSLVSALAKAGM